VNVDGGSVVMGVGGSGAVLSVSVGSRFQGRKGGKEQCWWSTCLVNIFLRTRGYQKILVLRTRT
jgi:hypothetical protein